MWRRREPWSTAARGDPADSGSDVFSVGAVAYHIMTGTPARSAGPGQNPIPDALASVLATALATKPEGRFQTMAQFGEAFERAWATLGGLHRHDRFVAV